MGENGTVTKNLKMSHKTIIYSHAFEMVWAWSIMKQLSGNSDGFNPLITLPAA